ncbi:hypothetical protein ACF064_36770 [Streptomyces sp. NPDC015492]|uniref:hypothetical protein n=1 Tax=Streptomyces sp. NPDC015492 TaxID=3364958 RepID=UPI0037033E67
MSLLGAVPGQVERSSTAAALARTGAAIAARVEAAGTAMPGRADRLCDMLAERGRAVGDSPDHQRPGAA